jgi:hypothetical protein
MPSVSAGSAVWFEPRSDRWTAEFLHRLASLASATPFGTAWMVARRYDFPGAVVVAADAVAADVVAAAAGPLPARLAPVGSAALGVPSERDRFAVVVRSGAEAGSPARAESTAVLRTLEPPPLDVDLSSDGPAPVGGRQCHWFSAGTGRLATRIRLWTRTGPGGAGGELARSAGDAVVHLRAEGVPVEVRELPNTRRRREAWSSGRVGGFAAGPLERLRPRVAAEVARGPAPPVRIDDDALARHVVVVGASGSGKSSLLAALAADRIARGGSVVAIDLHGDLGPAIAARVPAAHLGRVVAVDAGAAAAGTPGVRMLHRSGPSPEAEREASHLVAAFKRLTGDAGDVYWGFRLERTLDAFVRLAQEEGGGLLDVHELLTDPRRRDAARLSTRIAPVAAFLDELPALLRRNPEYLMPAAARVAKVALSPTLVRLLDPAGPGIPVAETVGEGRSILWRLPFAELGPEAAGFAATLLATHTYLALASLGVPADGRLRALLVVDEASSLSPRLVAEVLGEGRKFGVAIVLATQYPGRLTAEARAAAEGAAGTHVVFRVPTPVARATAEWAGLDPALEAVLSALPDGTGLVVRSGDSGGRGSVHVPPTPPTSGAPWEAAVDRSAAEFGEGSAPGEAAPTQLADAVAFALAPGPSDAATVAERATAVSGVACDPAAVVATLGRLVERGWVGSHEGRYDLTDAGARYLGVGAPTGAANEGSEHRALLYEAFALLARRGARLELVRQGRFDRRLPDAVVRQMPGPSSERSPAELAERLDRVRTGWAWRFFGGRDVDIEAEVSGALRPDRIRRNLAKSQARGTFPLFLVADPDRARRVRAVLSVEGLGPRDAQVWTLRRAREAAQPAGGGAGSGGGAAAWAGAGRAPDRC